LTRIVLLLYLFLLSISLLQSAFKLFGNDFAEQLITTTSNPFLGLMIGVIVTTIVQSSSVTTSLVVGLVGGGVLNLQGAIPMVMGANIGTTVTNTLVSLGHIARKDSFKRAYSASVVHDVFNLMAVAIMFPFQVQFDFLGRMAESISRLIFGVGDLTFASPVKTIVAPTTHLVVDLVHGSPWLLVVTAILLLFFSLNFLVKTLKGVVIARIQVFFDKIIFKNPVTGLLFGLVLTTLVQSSSITTSLIVPLAGAGLLTLHQVFPYTMGANVGTTMTAIIASLATGSPAAATLASAHLLFNVIGIVIIWPIRALPIRIASLLAELAVKNRLFPLVFLALFFYIIPLTIVLIMR
jgi:sodium-dependent phosphate cotransporter